jgi:hypothetical protein
VSQNTRRSNRGNPWYADSTDNAVGILKSGGTISELSMGGSGSGPAGVATGYDRELWVAMYNHADAIDEINITTGAVISYPAPSGATPYQLVTGPDGNVWFGVQQCDRHGRSVPDDRLNHPRPSGCLEPHTTPEDRRCIYGAVRLSATHNATRGVRPRRARHPPGAGHRRRSRRAPRTAAYWGGGIWLETVAIS